MFGIGIIEDLIDGKIEKIAEHLVMELINASPIGTALQITNRITRFGETAGASEVDKVLASFGLASFRGGTNLARLADSVSGRSTERRKAPWTRGGWAKSRKEWLNESWRHDWRSQPRDLKGRWIPGRLDHPVVGAPRRGSTFMVSRRGRKIRRFRNTYKRAGKIAGRRAVKGIVASWGRDGN